MFDTGVAISQKVSLSTVPFRDKYPSFTMTLAEVIPSEQLPKNIVFLYRMKHMVLIGSDGRRFTGVIHEDLFGLIKAEQRIKIWFCDPDDPFHRYLQILAIETLP